MMPEQLPIKEPVQPNWISNTLNFKFLHNPAVSLPYPYFSLLLIHC